MYAKLTDSQKERIGILIRYYRKKQKITQQAFLESKICARTTLSAIENGNVVKEDMVYYELLESMKLTYEPDAKWDVQMEAASKALMKAALSLNQEAIEQADVQIQALFQGKKQQFYYREYALAFHAVIQYLKEYSYIMSQEEDTFYMQTLAFFPEELRILLLHLRFSCCFNETENIKTARQMEPLLNAYSDNVLMKIDIFLLHVEARSFDLLGKEQQIITEELYKNKLWNRLYEFKAIKLREHSFLINHERKEMCDELYESLHTKDVSLHIHCENFVKRHLAVIYFSEYQDYARTYTLVKYLLRHDHQDTSLYMILLLLCEEKLGMPIHAEMLDPISYTKETSALYYFKHKYGKQASDNDRLDYIMKEIKPSLQMKNGSLFIEIFKREIEDILAKGNSKRYKDYFDFCMAFAHHETNKF